jgi:hypothetical protein
MKRLVKKSQKLVKGMPSAVVLSILIHAVLFLLAGMLVVFTVVKKEEKKFTPPKAVERPKMKLKKPKVKVKKTSKPKPTTRIVTKVDRANMPDIQLPEMSGMGGGLGGGLAGFDMMPDFGEVSVFGGGQSIGNDFEGTLYDFKRDRKGRDIPMDGDMFRQKVRDFALSGWKTTKLSRYYRSPQKLYTTHFMMPPLPSAMAPDVFGVPEMKSYYFMVHYTGKLVSKEPITFRFRGTGNAFSMVRVEGKEVFLACWPFHEAYFDWWRSTSADTRKYNLGEQQAAVGDWITLEPGKPLDMEIMFGEYTGGFMSAMLTVEVEGEDYERNNQGGPILPAFKTAEFSRDLLDEIEQYLPVEEASLTNGPVFRDYDLPSQVADHTAEADEPSTAPEALPLDDSSVDKMRTWTLMDGRTFDAEFVSLIGDKVAFKKAGGKLIKISQGNLSEADLIFIQIENPPELDISFSKKSLQRVYPESLGSQPRPTSYNYVFSAKIKQISTKNYDQELQVEVFAIGAEVDGDKYILLDRQKHRFTPTRENQRSGKFSGESVVLTDYQVGNDTWGRQHRGQKYASYLVVITDSRGEIIAQETPKKWLFEHLENLREIPVGRYFDKTCTRVGPTRPKRFY